MARFSKPPLASLVGIMEELELEIEMSKSRLLEFGRYAKERRKRKGLGKPETFDFLGVTFYCGEM